MPHLPSRVVWMRIVAAALLISATSRAVELFNNTDTGGVNNCAAPLASCSPQFILTTPTLVNDVWTYHWNGGSGDSHGGSIRLQAGSQSFGPFPVVVTTASSNVPANWTATINRTLPAGTYTIIDSNPSTWSQNSGSNDKGFAIVRGGVSSGPTHALHAGSSPAHATAPAPFPCTFRNGFKFMCFGQVI